MNYTETYDLLTLAAQFDNRKVDDAMVIAWQGALTKAGVEAPDARAAVLDHVTETTDYLLAAHIVAGARRIAHARHRAEREAREAAEVERYALEAGPTEDRSADVIDLVARIRTALPEGRPEKLSYGREYWGRRRAPRAAPEPNPHFRGWGTTPADDTAQEA